jgi:hypothetical protein
MSSLFVGHLRNGETSQLSHIQIVTTGLDPVVHAEAPHNKNPDGATSLGHMDCRSEPGNDGANELPRQNEA